jgi:phage-related protein
MDVVFYQTSRKTSPVIKFIDEQQDRDQAVILAVLNDVAENRFHAKGAQFRQLDGKLWEIKIKSPSGGYRFLYAMISKDMMMILHAFQKKTQKTLLNELAIARKRLAEVL